MGSFFLKPYGKYAASVLTMKMFEVNSNVNLDMSFNLIILKKKLFSMYVRVLK
jgi:hypothetical protein